MRTPVQQFFFFFFQFLFAPDNISHPTSAGNKPCFTGEKLKRLYRFGTIASGEITLEKHLLACQPAHTPTHINTPTQSEYFLNDTFSGVYFNFCDSKQKRGAYRLSVWGGAGDRKMGLGRG